MIKTALRHIIETARIPSFSSYEERLHPYVRSVFRSIPNATEDKVSGKNLLFRMGNNLGQPTLALAAHLDKINHYGKDYPSELPVKVGEDFIEGAMDDCAGLGMILTLAEAAAEEDWPNLLFFFSEMEESKGLKEHPELLRNEGKGYTHGMGAERIAGYCLDSDLVPEEVITLDTTPLFKGNPGLALYSKHWELNELDPPKALIENTQQTVEQFLSIEPGIKLDNNTNDYLHYGKIFNRDSRKTVVSVALEPAIFPYHQKGERVFISDIQRSLEVLGKYLSQRAS